jgi:hypothetical protein
MVYVLLRVQIRHDHLRHSHGEERQQQWRRAGRRATLGNGTGRRSSDTRRSTPTPRCSTMDPGHSRPPLDAGALKPFEIGALGQ